MLSCRLQSCAGDVERLSSLKARARSLTRTTEHSLLVFHGDDSDRVSTRCLRSPMKRAQGGSRRRRFAT
jgi:hypothetical protein